MGSITYIPQVKRFVEYYHEAIASENEEYQILLAIENLLYAVNQALDCYAQDKLIVSLSSEDGYLSVFIIVGENFVGKDGVEVYTINYVNIIRRIISLIELEINRSYLSLDVNIPTIPGFRNREVEQGTIEISIFGESMSGKFLMKQKVSIKKEIPDTIPGTPLSEIPVRQRTRSGSQADPTSRSLCGLLPYLCCLPSLPGASPSQIKQMLDKRRKTIAANARRSVRNFLLKYNSRIPFNLALTEPADSPCCSDFDSSDSGIEQNTDRTEDKYPDSQDPFFEGGEQEVKVSVNKDKAGWFKSASSDAKATKAEAERANFDFRYADAGENEGIEPTSPTKKEKRRSRADRTVSPVERPKRSLSFKVDKLVDSGEEGEGEVDKKTHSRRSSVASREPSKERKSRSNSIFRKSSKGKADKEKEKEKKKEEKEKEKEKKKQEKRGKSKTRGVERNDSIVLSDTERRDSNASGSAAAGGATPRRKSIFGSKKERKESMKEGKEVEEFKEAKDKKETKRKEKKEKRRQSKSNAAAGEAKE